MDISDWISTAIALASLGIVAYKEFLEGARLTTSLDQIGTLKLGGGQVPMLLIEVMIDDLMSASPSPAATELLRRAHAINVALATGDRENVGKAVVDTISRPPRVGYDPPPDKVRPYLSDPRFTTTIYLPLIVSNSGKRVGHISSILLIFDSLEHQGQMYAYQAMATIDDERLVKRHESQLDSERIRGVFAGVSVAPGASATVHALMVPLTTVKGRAISHLPLQAGLYRVAVFGYGGGNQLLFCASRPRYDVREDFLINALRGSEGLNYIASEDHLEHALTVVRSGEAFYS